ncbi:Response regulator [Roseovarius mucosus DSM 17069]|uniref:Response regulator n=1 Tax=Roseovarius mucosus DSM 17069 TaxID=1288298 RepID=A0A0A0HQ88_9RHOB|nr:LuxR family transcriptional regulator [Roseovarius mucosus]KGM88759.1 Response regulator [Roseovarius mucosus DSM 17069]MAN98557.1 LuxR family transcriptional regulator [Roseovarius sp.]MBD13429.1 LuxR family transcriptional regulator [Roseovarius sp.]|tara:strand:+ start:2166 stop:2921 length:756 start_codon:yes stop_codon:yes gene_type:complete
MIEAARVNTLLNAATIEELWDHHTQFMAEYGFDRLIYGYTRYRTATSLGNPDDFLLLTNHDPCYTNVFVGEGLYFNAPMVRWALENDGACSWSVLRHMTDSGTLTPEERRVIDFNQVHGVTAGYSISFKSLSPRTKGAIALTAQKGVTQSEVDALWSRCGEQILALNNVAHLRILSLPYTAPGRALTPRQREVLGWVGDGKTIQDIATIMGLTPATVEKHLRLARQALSVETTAQAVLKAAFQNQIFFLEN